MIVSNDLSKEYSEFDLLFDVILGLDNDIRVGKILDYKISRLYDMYNIDIKLNTTPDYIEIYLDCSLKDC